MTNTEIKDIIEDIVTARVGFIEWEKMETLDDTPVVIGSITPDDNSQGFLELRYAATAYDSTLVDVVGISGIKRVPFKKFGGVVFLGIIDPHYSNTGTGVMTSSDITIVTGGSGGEKIELQATGATGATATWDIVTIINSSITEI
jgi:hypothetical protein